ncbi:MAG: hypothetical protein LBH28_04300 [Oscillospiraceae bacterium]|jgi:hypothetical protein|nr:hypothetical protein [Oscillospiraceae bacterium]
MSQTKKKKKMHRKPVQTQKGKKASIHAKRKNKSVVGYIKLHPGRLVLAASCLAAVILLLCFTVFRKAADNNGNASNSGASGQGSMELYPEYQVQIPQEIPRPAVPDFVDLTALNSTMVYAEVYNIMSYPDDYMGKTIKMSGLYSAANDDEAGPYYHFVVIEDATACCQQGLEFKWSGDHVYPDDYPEENAKIEVTGAFGSYENEWGGISYYVAIDDISFL